MLLQKRLRAFEYAPLHLTHAHFSTNRSNIFVCSSDSFPSRLEDERDSVQYVYSVMKLTPNIASEDTPDDLMGEIDRYSPKTQKIPDLSVDATNLVPRYLHLGAV